MGLFIDLDWQEYVINEEHQVTCKVKPLEVWALQKLMGVFQSEITEGSTQEEIQKSLAGSNILERKDLLDLIKEVLPLHSKDLVNMEIRREGEEKRVATMDDIANIDSFLLTAFSILMNIFSISSMGLSEVSNLKKQSAD